MCLPANCMQHSLTDCLNVKVAQRHDWRQHSLLALRRVRHEDDEAVVLIVVVVLLDNAVHHRPHVGSRAAELTPRRRRIHAERTLKRKEAKLGRFGRNSAIARYRLRAVQAQGVLSILKLLRSQLERNWQKARTKSSGSASTHAHSGHLPAAKSSSSSLCHVSRESIAT